MTESDERIVVSGPASPGTVRVFRAVAASVASRQGMTIEQIDEFKVVVDEAATMLLRSGVPSRLELRVAPAGSSLRCVIVSDAAVEGWPGERSRGWSWRVIEQLAATAACVAGATGPEIEFAIEGAGPSA
jgi:hypothetical protein